MDTDLPLVLFLWRILADTEFGTESDSRGMQNSLILGFLGFLELALSSSEI